VNRNSAKSSNVLISVAHPSCGVPSSRDRWLRALVAFQFLKCFYIKTGPL